MTADKVVITILIPFRNAEPYLRACLDSICNQTESHWQVLAVNDHSVDGSAQIVGEYAKKGNWTAYFSINS